MALDPVTLQVTVPTGAADGPISVTTITETFSSTAFQVPPPDCVDVVQVTHARSITFKLSRRGVARGVVSSTEDPAVTECVAGVPVKIQRRKAGAGWRTRATTTTNDAGAYKTRVRPRAGKYRALAPSITLADESKCLRARSATVRLRRR